MLSDKHFIDWEHNVFGYRHGTGEPYTLNVLVDFFKYMSLDGAYCYDEMEDLLGAEQFWLLVNILVHQDILEYGTSPRTAWLTDKGKLLKRYLSGKSVYELYELATRSSPENAHIHCSPGCCNCDVPCNNPMFPSEPLAP